MEGFATPSATLNEKKDTEDIPPGVVYDHVAKGEKFQTPGGSLLSSPSSYSNAPTTPSSIAGISPKTGETNEIVLFLVGTLVGVAVAVATIIAFKIGRKRRRKRKCKESMGTSCDSDSSSDSDEVAFHDEYDAEKGRSKPPSLIRGKNKRPNQPDDWLGGVDFGSDKDESINFDDSNLGDFIADEKSVSKHSSCDSEQDESFNAILNNNLSSSSIGCNTKNNNNKNYNESDTESSSGRDTSTKDTENTPHTLDIGDECLSPRWNPESAVEGDGTGDNKYDELNKEQEELNQSLYRLNDQLVHQQRELEQIESEMTKKMTRRKHRDHYNHHKKITANIEQIEDEKEMITKMLKLNQKEIKAHRMERRRKLFLDLAE